MTYIRNLVLIDVHFYPNRERFTQLVKSDLSPFIFPLSYELHKSKQPNPKFIRPIFIYVWGYP